MKKILILMLALSLLIPITAMAATVGGQSNRYELLVDKVSWHHSGSAPTDSTIIALPAGVVGFAYVGTPCTSNVYEAHNLVMPYGGGVTMAFAESTSCPALDTVGVMVQWSNDKSTWFGKTSNGAAVTADVYLVTEAGFLGTDFGAYAVENATVGTTIPLFKWIRFIAWHADLEAYDHAAARFQLWWSRYVKVDD